MRSERFTMTDEHIALLRAANVDWCAMEYGAPCIDPKRPYGNSDVEADLLKMFSIRDTYDRNGFPTPETAEHIERVTRLHRETEKALQVVLSTGSFTPGVYVSNDYGRKWVREETA